MADVGGRRDSLRGLACVAAAALIWGSIPVVLRAVECASYVKVFYRVLFAGVVLLGWMAARGQLGEFRSLPRRKIVQLLVQGAILTVNWVLFLTALDMTNVATAELLGYLGPVFVAGLAPLVTQERFDARIVVPIVMALAGIAAILAPQGLGVSGGRQTLGAVLAFLSSITYAILLLRSKKILQGVSRQALIVVEYGVGGVLLLPFVLWAYAHGQGPATVISYGALAMLGVVHTALAGLLFLGGLRRVRTDHAAALTYVEPASAVVFAAAFLGEPLSWPTALGGALVVAGGALVARIDAKDAGFGPELAEGSAEPASKGSDADLD